jgi:general stress protein 26
LARPLTEQEIKDFLETKILNVHLGTVDEKGDANIHPAWYYYDVMEEKIYVETGKQSKKIDNLQRKKNVYFYIAATLQIMDVGVYYVMNSSIDSKYEIFMT